MGPSTCEGSGRYLLSIETWKILWILSSSGVADSGKNPLLPSDSANDVSVAVLESSNTQITSHKFNGHNYLQWSQTAKLYIIGRGKMEYLSGKKSWVWTFTAHEIWEAAKETYSSSDNVAEQFEIRNKIHGLRQEEMSVTQYYNILTRYWQQLDSFDNHSWSSTADAALYKTITSQKRVFQFLYGLNTNLDAVKGRIIATKPLPSLREAFSEVRREASRLVVMLPIPPQSEGSALVTHSTTRPRREKSWCDHCHKPGHVKDNCWKLHGKPANWRSSNRGKSQPDGAAHVVSADAAGQNLSKKIGDLQRLLSQLNPPSDAHLASTTPEDVSRNYNTF
ncbi:hypothetical protein GQ457_09G015230 [Hibiscus cannabinus]